MGKGSDLFAPYENVTREQMAVFMYRYGQKSIAFWTARKQHAHRLDDVDDISDGQKPWAGR